MKRLCRVIRLPAGSDPCYRPWHHLWLAAGLTALGSFLGVLSLVLSAGSCPELSSAALMEHYWGDPLLAALNLFPGVLLIWLFYFLTGRCWLAYVLTALPAAGLPLVNYYKISLRGDPLLAGDLGLASEAGGMVGNYTLELTPLVLGVALGVLAGLVLALVLLPRGLRRWDLRLFGLCSAAAVAAVAFSALYCSEDLYDRTQERDGLVNAWSDTENYVSRGTLYSFLYSVQDLISAPPEEYDPELARAVLEDYPEADIPEDQKVSVVGIMLEAFCDLTDFPLLAEQEAVQAVYEPWHRLEAESVSGDLYTNIFAGGTVDTEWAFLTGYSQHEDFTKPTDSYVWYFDRQGYLTRGGHPGNCWFYEREDINRYLGFQEYWFSENHYGALVDTQTAIYDSDGILTQEIVKDLRTQLKEQEKPVFSFSVSFQNHGPYEWESTLNEVYLDPEESGLPEVSCNVFNNYLHGVNTTISALADMAEELEEMEEPVVLVLFGDHKPWGGNNNAAYAGVQADFDVAELEGFSRYYSTPYLIWANSAAKETLGRDFQGEGGNFSPCFLMNEVFEQCGWTGPSFLQYAGEIREVTPLVHTLGLYLDPEQQLTDLLPKRAEEKIQEYLWVQYYREHEAAPDGGAD